MNFERLFNMQKELDAHIEAKHELTNENLFDRKVLALLVELGELANETRCFKFWSVKPAAAQETILEEYVDGVHFILSLGIELQYESAAPVIEAADQNDINEQFLAVFEQIHQFRAEKTRASYEKLFLVYLQLGQLLGFSAADIERAYFEKNEVNYERQKENY
ncbi:dUTP diphosphatase [Bacillus mesophilum]|uniref:dUTPase n=1 Tax=Bacillus mesophilum TaxID=1071718 RepID=A0A7V7UWA6_9BACI|nr:dUTP diphosphatase [Bacillus mesophilum]KAB2334176.1 dUTPase [Bacillus mesophilum]